MPSKTILLRSKHEGFAFRAYHAWPDGPAKGGLVLVQEIFGVTDHIRELCDQYATDGYDVIAPSLYDRQERGVEAAYDQAGIAQALKLRDGHDMKYSVGDVQACIDWLRDELGREKVFITGYCYGGTVSWVAACRCKGLNAASGYYGRGIVDAPRRADPHLRGRPRLQLRPPHRLRRRQRQARPRAHAGAV